MFAAEYEPASTGGRRRAPRTAVAFDAHLGRDGIDRTLCKVIDLSRDGAKLQTFSPLARGTMIWLTLPHAGRVAAEVMWGTDFTAGCRFRTPLGAATLATLLALG